MTVLAMYILAAWRIALYATVLAAPLCLFLRPKLASVYVAAFAALTVAALGPVVGFWLDGEGDLSTDPAVLHEVPWIWYAMACVTLFTIVTAPLTYARSLRQYLGTPAAIVAGLFAAATMFSYSWHRNVAYKYKSSAFSIANGDEFCIAPPLTETSTGPTVSIEELFKHANYPNFDRLYNYYSILQTNGRTYNWSFRLSAFVPSKVDAREPCAPSISKAPHS
jgi:hypothetical protein